MQIYSFLARKERISLKKTRFLLFAIPKQLILYRLSVFARMKDYNFAHKLLAWYHENRRILPWRDTHDPYIIWISEIILQQTRVVQGYDYFLRFMNRFPDVDALAAASEDEVLKCWQGLGYYSRARNLHAAARQIVEWGGFPERYENIRQLKGVGDYTAAAIASFAFGLPHAVVDGNVYRVLSRYYGIEEPIDTGHGKKYFAAMAQELLPEGKEAADYNQAVMDFGAMQCVPKSPKCEDCPLVDGCAAFRDRRIQELPVKSRALTVTERYLHYMYIEVGGEVAVFRRESNDIWKGLYEPFLIETPAACAPENLLNDEKVPSFIRSDKAVMTYLCGGVRHQLTHRTLICDFYKVELADRPDDFGRSVCWVKKEELSNYAFPRLVVMLFEKFGLW